VGYSPVRATYRYPTLVTFTATPSAHAHFIGWTGDTAATANPLTLAMSSNRSLTAVFGIDSFTVGVSTTGNGSVLPSTAVYPYGTPISLSATPAAGFHFTSWTGDTAATTNPLPIVVTRNRLVTAVFDTTFFALTVNVNGSGAVLKDPDRPLYPEGSVVNVSTAPATGWTWAGWTGDTTAVKDFLVVVMNSAHTYTANFTASQYTVTTSVTGPGTVTKAPNLVAYTYGQAVKLTAAVADTAHHFQRWSGGADGRTDTTTIIVHGPTNAGAIFVSNLYDVSVTIDGGGSVTRVPNQAQIYRGGNMQLTAVPQTGFQFEGWHGDFSNAYNPVVVRGDSNITLVARFVAAPPPTMTVTISGSGTVAKSPDQPSYAVGSTCTLTATPAAGWHFVSWSGDFDATVNPLGVVMDRNHNLTATFAPDGWLLSTPVVGVGTVARAPDQLAYAPNTAVTVTATPGSGSHFVAWAGDTSATTLAVPLVMTRNRTLQAQFGHTLTATNTANGKIGLSPAGGLYVRNTAVTLTPQPVRGYHFVSWSGDTTATTTPLTIVMTRDRSITAVWAPNRYRLALVADLGGTVAKTPDSLTYKYNTDVTIVAKPNPGFHFSGWVQDGLDLDNVQDPDVCEPCRDPMKNPLKITMNSDRKITAQFEPDVAGLQLQAAGSGTFNVTFVPQEGPDSTVSIVAIPEAGWSFAGWSGDATGGQNPLVMKLAGPTTLKATFVAAPDTSATTLAAPVVDAPTLALAAVSPNPVVGRARFAFSLPREERVTLDVIDIQGRQVAVLLDTHVDAGRHEVSWSAEKSGGVGVFFVRLRTADGTLTRRFTRTQ